MTITNTRNTATNIAPGIFPNDSMSRTNALSFNTRRLDLRSSLFLTIFWFRT